MSTAAFEATWRAKLNELLVDLKSDNVDSMGPSTCGSAKRLSDLIIGFTKDAKDLSLKEGNFDMDSLPFKFDRNKGGLLLENHSNQFEAAEHYRMAVGETVEEH